MKIFKAEQVRDADEYTIKNEPISSIDLMERAASFCTNKIIELYTSDFKFKIFVGPGNNGGDGLVIARLLSLKANKVEVYIVKFTDKFSPDFQTNLDRLKAVKNVKILILESVDKFPETDKTDILVDAIFGSGLTRALKGFPERIVSKINKTNAEIIAVDIPSGLFGEENPSGTKTVIKSTHTFTFQYPFLSFFYPENEDFVGEFHTIPIGIHQDYINNTKTDFHYLEKSDISAKIKKRRKFSHKGTYGHAVIFSGGYGKAGACVLAAKAAHRTGAGLVTAIVPKCNYHILQTSSPETMLVIDNENDYLTELPALHQYNALAIGPAIGFNEKTRKLLHSILVTYNKPIVIDADAITILSENKEWLKKIPEKSIFTPHPKEFERLFGKSENNYQQTITQIKFARKLNSYIILKGAHTIIATPEGKCYINSTGNPGMASGGSGDVLTGIIVSLLAQGYSSKDASIIGVYIHGLSGDKAKNVKGEEALIAGDLIENIDFRVL